MPFEERRRSKRKSGKQVRKGERFLLAEAVGGGLAEVVAVAEGEVGVVVAGAGEVGTVALCPPTMISRHEKRQTKKSKQQRSFKLCNGGNTRGKIAAEAEGRFGGGVAQEEEGEAEGEEGVVGEAGVM